MVEEDVNDLVMVPVDVFRPEWPENKVPLCNADGETAVVNVEGKPVDASAHAGASRGASSVPFHANRFWGGTPICPGLGAHESKYRAS